MAGLISEEQDWKVKTGKRDEGKEKGRSRVEKKRMGLVSLFFLGLHKFYDEPILNESECREYGGGKRRESEAAVVGGKVKTGTVRDSR